MNNPAPPRDIVDRLEQEARRIQLEALGERFNPSSLIPISDPAKLLQEAANEIKRLRIDDRYEKGYSRGWDDGFKCGVISEQK